jgi:uncharacterized YigZ family protein
MNMSKRYPIPAGEHRIMDEVKGSRFIATAAPAPDAGDARVFIERVRAEFRDATHNCWAYLIGPPGETLRTGSSDDGEPGGTAGTPILNVLLNSGMGDVVVVVTRYFGGVKLGRGGLVRAYGGSARRVLDGVPLAERVTFVRIEITVEYSFIESIRRLAVERGCVVTEEQFGTNAVFVLDVPEEQLETVSAAVVELTRGRAKIQDGFER